MYKNYLIAGFIYLFIGNLFAQLSVDFSLSSYADDNIYSSPYPTQDFLSDYSAYLSYTPDKTNINYYYNGDYTQYNEEVSRNYWIHELGISYYNPFGKDEQNTFYLGGYWLKRLDTEENYYYDYSQLYGYANLNFSFDTMFLKTGYNFRYRSYNYLPDLTNYRHYLFVQGNKSFQTRTSLILEADVGYKSYAGQEIFEHSSGDGGTRPPGHGPGGGGMMAVESVESTQAYYYMSTTTAIPSMGQYVLLARAAQSLTEKMGIYIQYRLQRSLTPNTDYKNLDTQYVDEELFDDPFSYESDSYSSQLSWLLPWQMKIEAGGVYSSKNYLNEYAYITEDDTVGLGGLRLDNRTNAYINFTKNFYFSDTWISAIRIYINYNYINNKSNSFWYKYKNNVFGGGLEFSF